MPLRGSAFAVAPLLLVPDARPVAPLAPGAGLGAAPAASQLAVPRFRAVAARPPARWSRSWGTGGRVGRAIDLLESEGWAGRASIVLVFSAWVVVSLPATPMEVAAGFLYGPLWGALCGLLCKTAGSAAAFLLARHAGRRLGWQAPQALGARLPALRSRPVLAMVGLRLAPLPLGVKNYGLGLSEVPLPHYLLAAFIVDLPFSLLWASTGASCHSLTDALSLGESRPQSSAVHAVPAGLLLLLAAWAACSWRGRAVDAGISTYIGTIAVDD